MQHTNKIMFLAICLSCEGMQTVEAVEKREANNWDIEYLNDPNCAKCSGEVDLFHIR